jgi:ABC-type dipeptide/oligopeptide/nickel transport system ATPase component
MADEVIVMYAGKIVERAPALPLFKRSAAPLHRSACSARCRAGRERGHDRLATIEGRCRPLSNLPPGCRFRRAALRRRGDLPPTRRRRCARSARPQVACWKAPLREAEARQEPAARGAEEARHG